MQTLEKTGHVPSRTLPQPANYSFNFGPCSPSPHLVMKSKTTRSYTHTKQHKFNLKGDVDFVQEVYHRLTKYDRKVKVGFCFPQG